MIITAEISLLCKGEGGTKDAKIFSRGRSLAAGGRYGIARAGRGSIMENVPLFRIISAQEIKPESGLTAGEEAACEDIGKTLAGIFRQYKERKERQRQEAKCGHNMSEPFILYKHPNKIDQLRKERKITIKVLAQRAGVGESTLYNMKNEKWGDSIKAEIAERIAAALGETPEKVFPDYARAKKEYEEKQAREKNIFSKAAKKGTKQ